MNRAIFKQYSLPFLGIVISLVLFFSPKLQIPYLDSATDKYFTTTLLKASGAYAIIRGLNATVSVLKESTFSLEPAGIGVSIAAGQVLDPINDMTERLSDVLVVAIVSLGMQKFFYEITLTIIPQVLAAALFMLSLMVLFKQINLPHLQNILTSLITILIIARLFLPLSTVANSYLHQQFFQQKIETASNEISLTAKPLYLLHKVSSPTDQGFWGKLKGNLKFVQAKTAQMKQALADVMKNMEKSITYLLQLTLLYIAIFTFQVILLPLFFVWLLSRVIHIRPWLRNHKNQLLTKPV